MDGKIKTFHANLLKRYVERIKTKRSHWTTDVHVLDGNYLSSMNMLVIDLDDETECDIYEFSITKTSEGSENIDIDHKLKVEEKQEVLQLVDRFSDVLTGHINILEHDIKTLTENPIRVKQYPLPYAMTQVINEEIDTMLYLNVIKPSNSPYSSPVIIMKRENGANRFYIHFIDLSRDTLFDAEPMPNREERFFQIAGNKYFSKIDLSKRILAGSYDRFSKDENSFPNTNIFISVSNYALLSCKCSCYL